MEFHDDAGDGYDPAAHLVNTCWLPADDLTMIQSGSAAGPYHPEAPEVNDSHPHRSRSSVGPCSVGPLGPRPWSSRISPSI